MDSLINMHLSIRWFAFLVFMTAAIIGYNPSKGMMMRKKEVRNDRKQWQAKKRLRLHLILQYSVKAISGKAYTHKRVFLFTAAL